MKTAMHGDSYLDSSFVWKMYVPEADSGIALNWAARNKGEMCISDLTDVEIATSLYRKLSQTEAAAAHASYLEDCEAGLYSRLAMNGSVYALAVELARKYAGQFGLRSLDSLHLALALQARKATLATFDQRLGLAAQAAGLQLLR